MYCLKGSVGRKNVEKVKRFVSVVQLVRGSSFRSDFLQNPYFNRESIFKFSSVHMLVSRLRTETCSLPYKSPNMSPKTVSVVIINEAMQSSRQTFPFEQVSSLFPG